MGRHETGLAYMPTSVASEKLMLWNQDLRQVALSRLRSFQLSKDSVKSLQALSEECSLMPDFKTTLKSAQEAVWRSSFIGLMH